MGSAVPLIALLLQARARPPLTILRVLRPVWSDLFG